MDVSSYRNALNPRLYQLTSPTVYRTVANILDKEHVVLPNRKTSYLLWFQNHRKQIIHYRCDVFRSLTSPCNRDVQSKFSIYSSHRTAYYTRAFFDRQLPLAKHFSSVHKLSFLLTYCSFVYQ